MTKMSRRQFLGLSAAALGGAFAMRFPQMARAQDFTGTLEFWDWNFDARADYMAELIEQFEAENDFSLDYTTYGYSDLQTRLLTAADAGNNPPFSNVHVNWRYELQKARALAPLPETLFDFDNLISTPFNRDPETGEIYTTTFNYYGDVVFYNRAILEEAGLTPEDIPNNWDDFLRLSRELTVREDGLITRPGCALNHYFSQEWLWSSMVYQQDAFLYNEAGNAALWDSDAGVQALDIIRGWYNDEPIDDYLLQRHFEQFGNGEAAMFISHGYWAPSIPVDYPDLEWGTVPIPTFTGEAAPAWGMALPEEGLAVFDNATDEQKAAAFSFIEFALGSEENRLQWAEIMTGPPDRADLLDAPELQDSPGNVIDSLAQTLPYRVVYGERPIEAEALWRTMFEEVIINNTPAAEAAQAATEAMNEVFEETGPRLITERNYTPPEAADDE